MATKRKASRSGGTRSSKAKPSARPRVARPGDNTLEGKAQPFLKRIETKLDDLDSKRGAYMAACKVVREDIKEIYGESKDHGIPVKALKALVEYRVLEKRQAKLAASFDDIDESAAYSQLVSTLGPLGFAAAQRAGYLPTNNSGSDDEERDVRPRHMRQPEATTSEPAPRADEAELARLGRGHDGDPPTAPEPPLAH
jgi:hypothetical protein